MKTTALVLLVGIIVLGGCLTNKDRDSIIRQDPVVRPYLAEETMVVFEVPKQIEHLQIGRVIIKREEDGILFSAMVIPNRFLAKGTKVELLLVSYKHNFSGVEMSFVVVK